MLKTSRFGVSLAEELLREFDRLIGRKGWTSRSEAIRDLIRNYLAEEAWKAGRGPAAGPAREILTDEGLLREYGLS